MYNNEPLECVENFKYLGFKVHSNHRWNECATHYYAYYAFEDTYNHGVIKCGSLRNTLRCDLLFGLIGHFGLLREIINISFNLNHASLFNLQPAFLHIHII